MLQAGCTRRLLQQPTACVSTCRRKRVPKAPIQDVDLFAPPAPAGPSALSFSEFGYVLRARAEVRASLLSTHTSIDPRRCCRLSFQQ